MPIINKPILGAALQDDYHEPPEGIQWWEFAINEGPEAVSPGSIPGLLPTYGIRGTEYQHNLIEEMPESPVLPEVTRVQGTGTKPWTIGAFLRIQYGYWLKDNANRARIKAAMEARPVVVTEGDPETFGLANWTRYQNLLIDPVELIDVLSLTYGHWVSIYGEPGMSASSCGVTVCMKPAEIFQLKRKQVLAKTSTLVGAPSWAVPIAETFSYSYDIPATDGSSSTVTVGDMPSNAAAWAAAQGASSGQSGNVSAWIAAANAVVGYERYIYDSFVATAPSVGSMTVPPGDPNCPPGIYYDEGNGGQCYHNIAVYNSLGDLEGYTAKGGASVSVIFLPPLTHPRIGDPGVVVSPGEVYRTASTYYYTAAAANRSLLVTASTENIQNIYTDGLYLDPPDASMIPPATGSDRAIKVATCGVVALVRNGVETAFFCDLTPVWPPVFSACSIGSATIPIDPATGRMCGMPGEGEGEAFDDLADIWPPQTVTYPGSTFLLQDGSEEPLYPTLYGSYVYDSHLKKWGKFSGAFSQLLDYSPLNTPQNGMESYARFGILGGIIDPLGVVRLFDTLPVRSKIVYGKFGYYRQGMTSPEECRVHFRVRCSGTLRLETSLYGKDVTPSLGQSQPYTATKETTLYGGFDGRWHNMVLEGEFDISYLEFRGISLGKR